MALATHTAEMVTDGHPDKFCDQVADSVLDACLEQDPNTRAGIECLAKDNLLIVSGELTTCAAIDVEAIARDVWESRVGYGPAEALTVITHFKRQSREIAHGAGVQGDGGVDFGGAGDQGIMIGFATRETPEMMPLEYELARRLCIRLRQLRRDAQIPWLLPDGKAQVTIENDRVVSVVLAAQHRREVEIETVRQTLRETVVEPVVGADVPRVVINGTGIFTIGGPHGDAGVVGRKVVADAYGPRVAVGGGAYSGKDPTKVDRSAAYMARHLAKAVVTQEVRASQECTVRLAYGIGQLQPEMITAVNDKGDNLSPWIKERFRDLSPQSIIERFGLRAPNGWAYAETAAFGHYGRPEFPWEQVDMM